MPECIRDYVLVPTLNGNWGTSSSQNFLSVLYSLSKVLERFFSNPLQFVKSGYSKSLCTGMIKNVISR